MLNTIKLEEIADGALQEKFERAFEAVISNLKDVNTPYKDKREIGIKIKFAQPETRDRVVVSVDISTKLAPQTSVLTQFAIGKDLKTGELYAEEYGKQIKGQMNINDYQKQAAPVIDQETGEIIEDNRVINLREAR